jgi:hypothetical protein
MFAVQMEHFGEGTDIRTVGIGHGYCVRVAGARAFEALAEKLPNLGGNFRLVVTVDVMAGPVRHRARDRREQGESGNA